MARQNRFPDRISNTRIPAFVLLVIGVGLPTGLCFSENASPEVEPGPPPKIEIGILEEFYDGHTLFRSDTPEGYRFVVRPVFAYEKKKWTSYAKEFDSGCENQAISPNLWRGRTWFSKERDGHIASLRSGGPIWLPNSLFRCMQEITEARGYSGQEERTLEFAGWLNDPVVPPRVLCTKKRMLGKDKDKWQVIASPEKVPESVADIVTDDINMVYLKPERQQSGMKFLSPNIIDQIKIDRVVCNKHGQELFEVWWDYDEKNTESIKEPMDVPICVLRDKKTGKCTLLADGMRFLCAGDFNGDRRSEIVFWCDRYNRNGYALFDSKFSKLAEFIWSYH